MHSEIMLPKHRGRSIKMFWVRNPSNPCAIAFAREGAAGVTLLDINFGALLEVKAEIEGLQTLWNRNPCQLETFTLDVTNEDQVNKTMHSVTTSSADLTMLSTLRALQYYTNKALPMPQPPTGRR